MTNKYDFKTIEKKWRPIWEADDLYQTGDDPDKPNKMILDFFPYPSGSGLSVGHCRNYVPTCISSRYFRMQGYNVLHPMGWDGFGLPAENYAIKHNIHPRESTEIFANTYKRQFQLVECSYDWSREINSTDPDYYRWTQYFFRLLFERGLAYQAVGSQWWCPECQTILANEQVEQGLCWRCDSEVTKKDLMQWYFKITEYADRLIADLDQVDWPEPIKLMQRNWIGRSEGADVIFDIENSTATITTFTTRPDTLFGVTFIGIAPEHPLLNEIVVDGQQTAVSNYITQAQKTSDIERMATDKEKTGVFTGSYAIHPLSGARIPIWVADYVMMGVGTGAVMGVPGHDSRDFAFARKFELPAIEVIFPPEESEFDGECFADYGMLVNSDEFSGMDSQTAIEAITAVLQSSQKGQKQVTYKLRDWLISRQRYWGAPIPIIHCPDCGSVAVPESDLPVCLPETDDFAPAGDGRSPLARIAEWVNVSCPDCGQPSKRETDTMDGFACSSWYFLRFASPHEQERPFDPEAVAKWLPVDTYVGGAEHAVMHLLYARFWTKVMFDAGMIDFVEPFTQLRNQGMLLSATDGRKMSKSKGNVVTPDEVIAAHGTDALRLYVVFLGPFDAEVTWDDVGIRGVTRFLDRYWRFVQEMMPIIENGNSTERNPAFDRIIHKAIKRITHDMERLRFNTAVAGLMEFLNELIVWQGKEVMSSQWQEAIKVFTLLIAPFAPFISEEIWQDVLERNGSVHCQEWPTFDDEKTVDEEVMVIVQVNGKVRDKITIPMNLDEEAVRETAVSTANTKRHVNNKQIKKVIYVPNKLINIVC